MISSLFFQAGPTPHSEKSETQACPINIFIGPNNSGKSQILSEIHQTLTNPQPSLPKKILEGIKIPPLSEEEIAQILSKLSARAERIPQMQPNTIMLIKDEAGTQVNTIQVAEALKNPTDQFHYLAGNFFNFITLKLNGFNRISLTRNQSAGNLQDQPRNSLQALLMDDSKRQKLRRIINDAFGYHPVVDPTNLGSLRLRLSSREPTTIEEERGISDQSVKFHSEAPPIEEASDGVRAFTGIMMEVLAGDPKIIILDEAEAFLHPSLAFKLGKELSEAASAELKQVFASTHSASFLLGCIHSGTPLNIIRLTYKNGVATTRVLSNDRIKTLMRHPLLRSSGILNGLFYDCVIVTESDSDRAFYQEINERLLKYKPEWGLKNALFINGHSWHSITTLVKPLRELGIPAAAIMDIDVLRENGKPWIDALNAVCVPTSLHRSIGEARAAISKAEKIKAVDIKKNGGIELLDKDDQISARILTKNLAEFGLFIVPTGEVESWLQNLDANGHGPTWLIEIFEKMGEDPASQSYLKPQNDDVWRFISEIKAWIDDQNRKGIPD